MYIVQNNPNFDVLLHIVSFPAKCYISVMTAVQLAVTKLIPLNRTELARKLNSFELLYRVNKKN